MEFEWDENKNISNQQKHGLSFAEACMIFEGPVFTWMDVRQDYGEIRQISIGAIENQIIVVVAHTQRGNKIRLISARCAKQKEKETYYAYLKKAFERN